MGGKRDAGDGTFWQKKGRWYGKRRIGSREAPVVINASGATLADAKANLRDKVERHERGAAEPLLDPSVTVGQYLEWWVDVELAERVADGAIVETSRQQYGNKVRFQITPYLGDVPLRDLSAMRVRNWMTTLARAGASATLRRHALSVLRNALNRAVRYELVAVDAAQAVDMPKVYRRRRDEITLDAARRLLETVRGDELEAAYVLALHIPMRVGEVIGLEWAAVDLDAALLSVRQNLVRIDGRWELHDTKNHKPRKVPLPPRAVGALRTRRRAQAEQRLAAGSSWEPAKVLDVDRREWRTPDLVFTRRDGQPLFRQGFNKRLQAVCERAEVPSLATHDLRRAANTLLLTAGVDPVVVRQLAGHLSEEMTELYTTRLDSRMAEAVATLGQHLA